MGFFYLYKMSRGLTNRFLSAAMDYLTFLQSYHNAKL